jgi:hypothetical protein
MREQRGEVGLKCGVLAGLVVFDAQLVESANERFGHVSSAECAKSSGGIGNLRG